MYLWGKGFFRMVTPNVDTLLQLVSKSQFSHDVRAFLVDREAGGCSPRTLEYYSDELRYLGEWLTGQGISVPLSITPDLIRRYLLALGKRRNPGGVHCAYRVTKTFLRWYEAEMEPEGWTNPVGKVKAPRVPQKPLDPVSTLDLKAMLGTCDKSFTGTRDNAIFLALLDTGCRASEFVALNINDVNLSSGTVLVRHGKGGRVRSVFLGAKSRRALLRYLRHRGSLGDSDPLWVTVEGRRLAVSGLRQISRRRAKRAGVTMPGLHSFRRGFALACLRNGVDLISLQRLMGHSDLSVLRRYLAQTEDDLADAHRRAGPVDRLL